ncbi:MAG: trans-sulfuration enzyme family protein [Chitinophagales bacterium]
MKFGSKLIHNGNEIDKYTGALSIPIYQASTYHLKDLDTRQEFGYSRSGNPTRKALEETIAVLEGGTAGFAFASGMAAISSVLAIFSAGDHLLVCEDVYGGTNRICSSLFKQFNIETTFFDGGNLGALEAGVKENTRALLLETPSNPLLKITDLRAVIRIAKEHGLLVIIDNTFMSPYLQRPIELGADIVIHSATKFIGGHSDVLGGLVITGDDGLAEKIYSVQTTLGAVLGPQDSWLLLRGLKTLKVRLDYEQKNASLLAEWLSHHPAVTEVFYPGLPHHEGHAIHMSQADGPGAVLSFRARDTDTARRFLNKVKLAVIALSLGGVETIVSYPVIMSHASVPVEQREKLGITDNLIRISLGLEDIEDLIQDFSQAFLP